MGENAVDNSSSETVGLLEASGQLAWAALTSITAAQDDQPSHGRHAIEVGPKIPPELFRDDRVIESLWAATVALDAATAIRIGRFDLDLVGPRARPDEVATFRTLAAWWTGSPEVGSKLIAALEATDPPRADEGSDEEDRLLDIAVPVLAAMRFAVTSDAAGSTREIQLGGEAFDKYWGRPGRKSERPASRAGALGRHGARPQNRPRRRRRSSGDPGPRQVPEPRLRCCSARAAPSRSTTARRRFVWCHADLTVDATIEEPFTILVLGAARGLPCVPRCTTRWPSTAWSCHQPLATE